MTTPTHFFIKLAPWHGIHVWWVQHPGQGGPYSLTPGATTWPLAGEDAPKHPILCVGKCCGPALGDPRCLCINSIACLHSLVDMSMQWPILRNRSVPTILFTPGSPWWAPLGLFLVWCSCGRAWRLISPTQLLSSGMPSHGLWLQYIPLFEPDRLEGEEKERGYPRSLIRALLVSGAFHTHDLITPLKGLLSKHHEVVFQYVNLMEEPGHEHTLYNNNISCIDLLFLIDSSDKRR